MRNDDYIIAFDEEGQPYIAHAFGDSARAAWGSVSGRAKKYIARLKTKSGKWRYIYDPRELAAVGKRKIKQGINRAAAAGRKAKQFIDDHDGGASEAIRYMRANRSKKMSGQQKAQYKREYEESALGRADKAARSAAKAAGKKARGYAAKAASKARTAKSAASATVKKYGFISISAARKGYGTARKGYSVAKSTAGKARKKIKSTVNTHKARRKVKREVHTGR